MTSSPQSRGPILLEVCVASADDAIAAAAGGADRIELNAALELDGLTPSIGLLREVRQALSIPIVAMVRPRAGGFCYSAAEFSVMQRDVDLALENGADGVAFGVLTQDREIDLNRCRQLVRQVGSNSDARFQGAAFHRAFDFTLDPKTTLEALVEIGFRRVMTSGGQSTALQGASVIRELITQAANRIEVMPAGGIRGHNVAELIARTGCNQVHASVTEASPQRVCDSGVELPGCALMARRPLRMSRPLLGDLADALSAHRTHAAIPTTVPTPAAGEK